MPNEYAPDTTSSAGTTPGDASASLAPSSPPSGPPAPPLPPLRLKELTPAAVAAALDRDARLIIPVGTCEQHGRHLPMGCDTIIVEALADHLSGELQILRAPTVEYGVNTVHERVIPGNATVRRKTLLRTLNDLTDAWEAGGIGEFIFLTAHGNDGHLEALSTVITKGSRVRVVDILSIDVSDLTTGRVGPMHGDEIDTSLLLYLAPHLVHMDDAEDYMFARTSGRRYRRSSFKVPKGSSGSVGRPTLATAATGEAIYTRICTKIRDRIFIAPPPEE